MTSKEEIEVVARVLAGHFGPEFDNLPKDKTERQHWMYTKSSIPPDNTQDDFISAANDLVTTLDAHREKQGLVTVPVEPSYAMLDAGNEDFKNSGSIKDQMQSSSRVDAIREIYKRMLSKRNAPRLPYDLPQTPSQEQEQRIEAPRNVHPSGPPYPEWCDRTHEECADCALENVEPPQCHGHPQGPVACPDFKVSQEQDK